VLPLVAGGDVHVGPPITTDDHDRLRGELDGATVPLVAIDDARAEALAVLCARPPALVFGDDELALAVGLHNALVLAHPDADGALITDRMRRRSPAAALGAVSQPLARDRTRVLARHGLLHNLHRLGRRDLLVSWWTGKARFFGQAAPARLTAWRGLRRVREDVTRAGFDELLAPRGRAGHRRAPPPQPAHRSWSRRRATARRCTGRTRCSSCATRAGARDGLRGWPRPRRRAGRGRATWPRRSSSWSSARPPATTSARWPRSWSTSPASHVVGATDDKASALAAALAPGATARAAWSPTRRCRRRWRCWRRAGGAARPGRRAGLARRWELERAAVGELLGDAVDRRGRRALVRHLAPAPAAVGDDIHSGASHGLAPAPRHCPWWPRSRRRRPRQRQRAGGGAGPGGHFLDKQEIIRLMLVSAIAGEHMVIVGPPGTAKSAMVGMFAKLVDARYFEYLLTRFTEPNELFGPVDIAAFREGKLHPAHREHAAVGRDRLPRRDLQVELGDLELAAHVINERKFANGPNLLQVPLISLFAASNEVPNDDSLGAMFDRFLLRVLSDNLDSYHFGELMQKGIALEVARMTGKRRRAEADPRPATCARCRQSFDRFMVFPDDFLAKYKGLIFQIRSEGVSVSDRRAVKLLKLFAASAVFDGRTRVHDGDFFVLRHIWNNLDQVELLAEIVNPVVDAYYREHPAERRFIGPQASLDDLLAELNLIRELLTSGTELSDIQMFSQLKNLSEIKAALAAMPSDTSTRMLREVDQLLETVFASSKFGL
jgi:MoxR-like ATPase